MDGGLGIKLSPFAAAAALGAALITICIALWKRDNPEQDKASAEETTDSVKAESSADTENSKKVEVDIFFREGNDKSALAEEPKVQDSPWLKKSACSGLLSPTVHSSSAVICDESTLQIPGVEFWPCSTQRSTDSDRDNELRSARKSQKSIDVIRQEFVGVVAESSGLDPVSKTESYKQNDSDDYENDSQKRGLDRHSSEKVRNIISDPRLNPFLFPRQRPNLKSYSRLRGFHSLPDVFNIPPKFPLLSTKLEYPPASIAEIASKVSAKKQHKHDDKANSGKDDSVFIPEVNDSFLLSKAKEMEDEISERAFSDSISEGNRTNLNENVTSDHFKIKTTRERGADERICSPQSESYHYLDSVVSHLRTEKAANVSSYCGQLLKNDSPTRSSQRYEVNDALIRNICMADDINKNNNASYCAAKETFLPPPVGSGGHAVETSHEVFSKNFQQRAAIHDEPFNLNESIESRVIEGDCGRQGGGEVSQVDHLALEGCIWESESVTAEKGSGEGARDVTRGEVPRSRGGTIWGVADDRTQLVASDAGVVVARSMEAEDPLDAIVRDLKGICDGFHHAGNGSIPSRKKAPQLPVKPHGGKKSVIEVSSVSECLFTQDYSGTIESTLSLESALSDSSEDIKTSSTYRDSSNGDIHLHHRIESSVSAFSESSDGLFRTSSPKNTEDRCLFRPTFEEFAPELDTNNKSELNTFSEKKESPVKERAETPPLSRLMVLLDRDQERRSRSKFLTGSAGESPIGENGMKNGITRNGGVRSSSGSEPRPPIPPKPVFLSEKTRQKQETARGSAAHRQPDNSKPDATSHVATTKSGGGEERRGEEWDALMRNVLASVSELERWEKQEENVAVWRSERREAIDGRTREDTEPTPHHHSTPGDHAMETASPTEVTSLKVATTPTKVKNLRFKLDPDIYDVPSDDSFYDDDEEPRERRGPRGVGSGPWRKHPTKYQTFSALELGSDEPVQLVSVRTSVVPPGHKMVVKPVVAVPATDEARMRLKQLDIDLHIRLEGGDERHSKRVHHSSSTSPAQAKRKSPVSDRTMWCQELSPVSENVDWRETWSAIGEGGSPKVETPPRPVVPNGILKMSPKTEKTEDKSNPFKPEEQNSENGVSSPTKDVQQNGVKSPLTSTPTQNGFTRKLFLPRKKFVPDPEAIERITGYKMALAKPPLPPPPVNRTLPSPRLGGTAKKRVDSARKQYFDHKAAMAAAMAQDGSNQKFQQFLAQAQSDRARIVTSTPDLGAIEQAVMAQWLKSKASSQQQNNTTTSSDTLDVEEGTPSRSTTPDDVWSGYVQMCRRHLNRRSRSLCYLETDIDAIMVEDDKAFSLTALNEAEPEPIRLEPKDPGLEESSDDLADSGHAKSEHEIRVEKSLRNLSLPDWYRNCEKPKSGFLLGSANSKEKKGWAAAKSLASSTSSLTSCGVRRSRPIRSLRSSQENLPWSRGSVSPAETDHGLSRSGPALSLALARAFREPYLGWRARTPSSGVSSSPQVDMSPPSWVADSCDTPLTSDLPPMDEEGVSFDGEDVILVNTSSELQTREEDGDTCEDVVTMSMDTCDGHKELPGEDTCDDINNMSMDTCELFPPPTNGEQKSSPLAEDDTCDDVRNISSDTAGINGHPSPLNTGDDINNLSTDASESQDSSVRNGGGESSSMYQKSCSSKKGDMKRKRYSYSQSIYNSEWDEDAEENLKRESSSTRESSPSNKIIWIESSFVGSRTTTSIVVLPTQKDEQEHPGNGLVRPASR